MISKISGFRSEWEVLLNHQTKLQPFEVLRNVGTFRGEHNVDLFRFVEVD